MRNKIAAILNLVEDDEKLKPLTNRRPIASLPFACRYRLIDFPFSSLYNAEAISAALFISGSGHSLYDHIRSGATWGLDSLAGGGVFTHSQVRLKTEKTTDIVKNEKDKLVAEEEHDPYYYEDHYTYVSHSEADYVLLISSSMLANIPLDEVIRSHEEKASDLTVVYKNIPRDSLRNDAVFERYTFDEANPDSVLGVTSLTDITSDSTEMPVGLDVMVINQKTFFDYLHLAKESSRYINVKNFLQFAFNGKEAVYGFEYTGYLNTIEDIPSYFEANMDMLDEEKFNALFHEGNPIVTKAKNSAPTYYGETAETTHSQFANDCEIYGKVHHSLLFRKVRVEEGAKVEHSIVMQDCQIEEGAELKYVILDKHVYVKKGAKLIGTPENPIVIGKNEVVNAEGELVKG